MNWYKGNISEAVAQSKAKNAIFVVFVEGKDESTQKLTNFINEQKIRTKLESDDFVAIKIESESQAYMQFATIYQVVPVPSIFFIGKSGTPLEIGTGIIETVDELEQKIEKVLVVSGRSTPSSSLSASSSFIAAEQRSQNSEPTVVQSSASAAASQESESDEVVCDGDVCYKKPKDTSSKSEKESDTTKVPEKPTVEASVEAENAQAQLQETRKLLEQKRRERIEMENKLEKERELQRRRDGKDMQKIQQQHRDQELKELRDNLRRQQLEEQAARERIRAQIAADRAERAQKFAVNGDAATTSAAPSNVQQPKAYAAADKTRLQFRFPNGDSAMNTFNINETLGEVRSYVRKELLPGTGIKDFILATTYPKREFTADHDTQTLLELELVPSAVILIIGKEMSSTPAAIIARSGGLFNMLNTLVMALLSPVFALIGYFQNWRGGRGNSAAESGAAKRANEERGAQHEAAKRRNLDRFGGGSVGGASSSSPPSSNNPPSDENNEQKPYRRYGSSNIHRLTDNRKDSDDENATWNGNSTQQQ